MRNMWASHLAGGRAADLCCWILMHARLRFAVRHAVVALHGSDGFASIALLLD